VEAQEAIARVAVTKAPMAPNGCLHAGTVVTLADACCGYGTVMARPRALRALPPSSSSPSAAATALSR
jgi:acyl-coenzyme A thioesterase PaaI-like protein